MSKATLLTAVAAGLLASVAMPVNAQVFNRIASFEVALNAPEAEATSSEIIAASEDGMTIVYSDSPGSGIGFVDISDPANPQAAGYVAVDGEPTSVTVIGDKVYAGVNTSESFVEPSGHIAVIDIASQEIVGTCDVAGQPDSVAGSPDGSLLAVAIENERDEDLNDGEIPQMPAGNVTIFPITDGMANCDAMMEVDVTGLAEVAPSDPEPEFTDFNANNELVVSLQENNHFVVIDGETGEIVSHFSAGAVDLANIDTEEEGALRFTDSQEGRVREPDGVRWIDNDRFVAANEGDYNGGSRGFTIYSKDGAVLFESGPAMEYITVTLGHYPEDRSGNKGVEPEGMEVATFGEDTLIFVMQERSSVIAVYRDTGGEPEYIQSLPSGMGPESAVAIPSRNLLVSANEEDMREDGGPGSHVMVFEYGEGEAAYPTIVSEMVDGLPIGWGALSGLVAGEEGTLYAVSDSAYGAEPAIFTIDARAHPAVITGKTIITRNGVPAQKIDPEGIALDGEGGFFVASEGRSDRLIPHAIYHVGADGEIEDEIALPVELLDNEIRFGFEGVTVVGEGDDATLWMAVQREWRDDEKGFVKLVSYNLDSEEWGAVSYPLDAPVNGGWVGLSEITAFGDHVYIVERDNQIAQNAAIKKLYRVAVADLAPGELGGELPVVAKEEVRDFIPDLQSFNGYVVDKIEGFAIAPSGEGFVVTDNDGVDDSSGETFFWSIGPVE
ncbi:esterase-like activity of phytase family protein [Pelagibacterium halotolerans]|uniref:esterase-like activity of phytase family protein n=1 Tax=Pelagibacterium halotolerans TaxID=531813 RepID=UPI00384D085A